MFQVLERLHQLARYRLCDSMSDNIKRRGMYVRDNSDIRQAAVVVIIMSIQEQWSTNTTQKVVRAENSGRARGRYVKASSRYQILIHSKLQ